MSDDRTRDDRPPPLEGESRNEPARDTWFERLIHRLPFRARESIREELEDALSEQTDDDFSPQERAMLKNVLGFHRIRVSDVMVPRADIVAVPADTTLGELLGLFRTAGHSRLPVYGETLDDPLGMIHIRDFLDFIAAKANHGVAGNGKAENGAEPDLGSVDLSVALGAADILRPVLFVPQSMRAVDLLVRMQATRTHIALVIDEYGGTDGLVSIEDLVETVVGDIEDEHDDETDEMIVKGEDDDFVADGRATLEELSEALGRNVVTDEMAEEVDTLGGLIVMLAGRVPSRGELIAGPSALEFEVLDADPRRIKRVRIHRRASTPPGAEAAAEPARSGTAATAPNGSATPMTDDTPGS